jgi:N utilization substance protein A
MNNEILDALSQITREKSVDRAMLIETLEMGLASAVRKKHGATADVEWFANEQAISVALRRKVVSENPHSR